MKNARLDKEIKHLKRNLDAVYAEQKAEREQFAKEHPEEMCRAKFAIDLAFQLHMARKRAKLSQAEVAAKLNTKQSSLSRMERGGNYRLETLQRYAEACGRRLVVKIV